MKKQWIFFVSIGLAMGCHQVSNEQATYTYSVPEQLNDGIEVSYLATEDLDYGKIEDMMNNILKKKKYSQIHSILILKNGKLVLEEYFGNWKRERLHEIQCCTKSIISALIGISIEKGFIKNIDQDLFSFFPEHADLNDSAHKTITLKHVITKTPGLEWNEHDVPYSDSSNNYQQMRNSTDPIRYVLGRPMVSEPGQVWGYNSGCSYLLGGIIKNISGIHADEFAQKYLFDPLGISEVDWVDTHPSGLPNTAGGLWLRPRDMAKFGLLYINMGRWISKQLVPEEWVKMSTQTFSIISENSGYAWHWWTHIFKGGIQCYEAAGGLGQYIWVFPSKKMVVVFAQGYINNDDHSLELLSKYILPAAIE